MSLKFARTSRGEPINLGDIFPVPCEDLLPLVGTPFRLPCEDPWLEQGGSRGHEYLQNAREAWSEHPDWMNFLEMDSPAWNLKRAERDLYLHWLDPWRKQISTVLDVGCGIGRLTHPFLDQGATVIGVDGDLKSLQRCAWHAANRAGSLDLHWGTPSTLPPGEFDLAIACEVLCYVEDPAAAVRKIAERIRPGGILLLTMEARWGWATAQDTPGEGIEVALGGPGPLDLPGDRYVHVLEGPQVRALAEQAELNVEVLVPTHYLCSGPLEDLLPADLTLETHLALEERCRNHPVWKPLNRIWTCIASKPV